MAATPHPGAPDRRDRSHPSPSAAPKPPFAFARLGSPLRWTHGGIGTALLRLPAIAICLAAGIALGQAAAGMVAAGGALSVRFGAFQQLSTLPNGGTMAGGVAALAVHSAWAPPNAGASKKMFVPRQGCTKQTPPGINGQWPPCPASKRD